MVDDPTVIRISPETHTAVRIEAAYRGQTMKEFADRALRMAVHKAKTAREKRERKRMVEEL